MSDAAIYLAKALECLASAEAELLAERFNSCANRSYYSCFQAAISALILAKRANPSTGKWSHAYVQSEFSGQLVGRQKRFPAELRDTLSRNMDLRHIADYEAGVVTEIEAARALRRARAFVQNVRTESERST